MSETNTQREQTWINLRAQIDSLVCEASAGDPALERFLRRKLENWAIDQGSLRADSIKRGLKILVYDAQKGLCAECSEPLPSKGWELDRLSAEFQDESDQGYRLSNVQGVHAHCHIRGPHPAGRRIASRELCWIHPRARAGAVLPRARPRRPAEPARPAG